MEVFAESETTILTLYSISTIGTFFNFLNTLLLLAFTISQIPLQQCFSSAKSITEWLESGVFILQKFDYCRYI